MCEEVPERLVGMKDLQFLDEYPIFALRAVMKTDSTVQRDDGCYFGTEWIYIKPQGASGLSTSTVFNCQFILAHYTSEIRV